MGRKKLVDSLFVGAVVVGLVSTVYAGLHLPDWVEFEKPRYRGCGKRSCIANLKQIEGAIQQWALETKKVGTDRYTFQEPDLLAYLKSSRLPECPQGGEYQPGVFIDAVPLCSHGPSHKYDHKIQMPKKTLAERRKEWRPGY